MEKITRINSSYYYGAESYSSADAVYKKFRNEYHKTLKRNFHYRLDTIGQRKERIHGFGFVFKPTLECDFSAARYTCFLLGLVDISYVRSIGIWEYKDIKDEDFGLWLDWIFRRGTKSLRLVGAKDKVGRTSKRLKTRYR